MKTDKRYRSSIQVGQIYNSWQVLEKLPKYKFKCLCLGCNKTERVISGSRIKITKSCGCQRVDNRKHSNLEKYGKEHTAQLDQVKAKIRQTCFENYGTDNPRKANEVKQKIRKIKQEKYGENYEQITKKIKQTTKDRYGVENPSLVPEFQKKKEQTFIQRFGGLAPICSPEIQEKIKRTCIERYGVSNPLLNKDVYKQSKDTLKQRYGVQNPSQSIEIKKTFRKLLRDGSLASETAKKYIGSYSYAYRILREHNENIFARFCNNSKRSISSLELRAIELFKSIDPKIEFYNKKPVELNCYRRPDFKLEVNNKILYINVDGLFHHSERKKDINYHWNLREEFQSADLHLMQFREDELKYKPQVVKAIVQSYLGLYENKIDINQCAPRIVSIELADQFYRNNSLADSSILNTTSLGLFFREQLVACISFKEVNSFTEIVNFAILNNTSLEGGFKKLSDLIKENGLPIIACCDLRYQIAMPENFKIESASLGWRWTDGCDSFNHSEEQKPHWYKIYDAGQARFKID